jgi:hypothetical protein
VYWKGLYSINLRKNEIYDIIVQVFQKLTNKAFKKAQKTPPEKLSKKLQKAHQKIP